MTTTPGAMQNAYVSHAITMPVPVPQGSTDASLDDPGTTLTPDSLMAYCESRLDSIGSQVQASFDQQTKNASVIGDLQQTANEFKNLGTLNQGDTGIAQMQADLKSLISNVQGIDANSSVLPVLQKTLDSLNATAGDHNATTTEIQQWSQDITDSANNLNSDSELQMVQLQSLMSQRQTAISLTTNLIQSLDDGESKVVDNIGK